MRFTLAYKLVLFFSIFTAISVFSITAYSYIKSADILEIQIRKDLTAIAEATEGQIFLFFEKNKNQIKNWSSDGHIRREFEAILKTKDQKAIDGLSQYIKTNKHIFDLNTAITDILGVDGKVIVSTVPERIGHEEPIEEIAAEYAFDRSVKAEYGEAFIATPAAESGEPGHTDDFLMWHVSTPIFSIDGKTLLGVMVNHFKGEEMNDLLAGRWQIDQGALSGQEFLLNQTTSEMFLINKDGYFITPSRFINNAIMNVQVDNPATKACFDKKKEFSGGYIGYYGGEVEVSTMCFVDYGVVLLAEIGREEIFDPLAKSRNLVVMAGLGIWIVGVFIIFLFSKLFLRGILSIRKTAKEVGKGNYKIRAEITSRDEIGDLAEAFNKMLESIEHSRKDLMASENKVQEVNKSLEKLTASLDQKIKDRTKELEDVKATLELRVHEKTLELKQRLDELEKFKKLTIGRELRMIELKEEMEMAKKKVEGK